MHTHVHEQSMVNIGNAVQVLVRRCGYQASLFRRELARQRNTFTTSWVSFRNKHVLKAEASLEDTPRPGLDRACLKGTFVSFE